MPRMRAKTMRTAWAGRLVACGIYVIALCLASATGAISDVSVPIPDGWEPYTMFAAAPGTLGFIIYPVTSDGIVSHSRVLLVKGATTPVTTAYP